MAFCGKCGIEIEENVKFCPGCGEATGAVETAQAAEPVVTAELSPDKDAQDNKTMAILAYILCIPLFTGDYKKSPFVKFHTNQGAVLYISSIGWSIISGIVQRILYTIGLGFIGGLLGLVNLGFFILWIVGIVNASNGKKEPLPVIGELFTIIK